MIEPDAALAARLVATQFPQWAQLPVRPVGLQGSDNRTFRLGDALSVRLPTGAAYAHAVTKEHRWLPYLAPHVPLPIPTPVALGRPADGYPFEWSVYRWLPGRPLAAAPDVDPIHLARDLGAFLAALHAIPSAGGPPPGEHNFLRGAPPAVYDAQVRAAPDIAGATEIWARGCASTWTRDPVWFHGDVAAGNLLVRDGRLRAVIDFGTCGVGDPACDLVIAWTLFEGEARTAFRDGVGLDDDTWDRGRAWALWKALITVGEPEADRTLRRLLAEPSRRGDRAP